MLELQREGPSKDRVQQAKAPERHGGGLVEAKTVEAIVAISTTSLAAVWNGYSNAEGGYNKEWQLELGGTGHVARDGTDMTDYTPAEPGSTQDIYGGRSGHSKGLDRLTSLLGPKWATRHQRRTISP